MIPTNVETLHSNLQGSTPIYFAYYKKDGSIRNAFGTLNMDLIPDEFHPKGEIKLNEEVDFTASNLKYFDLDKNGWRSLPLDSSAVFIFE